MGLRKSESSAHAYEAEPCPIFTWWPEFWWMREEEKSTLLDRLAQMYGGQGYLPRLRGVDQARE